MAGESTKRAPVDMLCLALLGERDMYGYEMVQAIAERSGGRLQLAEAALYMAMYKLVQKGYVTDRREPESGKRGKTRIYYHLEPAGKAYLTALIDDYNHTALGVQSFMAHTEGMGRP